MTLRDETLCDINRPLLATLGTLTFQDDLNKVLGRHLAMPGEALIGPAVTLGHTRHDQILPVLARHANAVARVDELPVAVPGQLVLLRAGDAARQRDLASHAALHLPWAHRDIQGFCGLGGDGLQPFSPEDWNI